MIGAAGRMVLVVFGLLLVLTYLLLRGATPDAALYERRLRAIDALILNQAALQRDVLRASHGLLLNYDPLVATVRTLREVAEELRGAAAAKGASSSLIESIAKQLDEQEALVEEFKSSHALLRNSLTYFGHLSRELGTSTSQAGEDIALVVGRLVNSVFRFVGGSTDDAETAEVAALLDKLSILAAPAALRDDVTTLRAHGDLILRTLPAVDGILARLLATRVSADAGALRDLFVEEHRRAERLAWIFRVLLYLASVALLVYLSHLYVRLRANARTLKARSDFEHLIAGISAQLIDTRSIGRATESGRGSSCSAATRAWIAPTSCSQPPMKHRTVDLIPGVANKRMRLMAGRTTRWQSGRPGARKLMNVMAASTFPPFRHCRQGRRKRS